MNIVFFKTVRFLPRQFETLKIIDELAPKYDIKIEELTDNPYDYARAMKKYWAKDDLMFIEHDIVFTEQQLKEIIDCKYPDCCALYKIYQKHGLTHYAQGYFAPDPNGAQFPQIMNVYHLDDKIPEFIECPALGFTKFSKAAMLRKPVLPEYEYINMDFHTYEGLGIKYHVHSEIGHNHKLETPA